MSRDYTAPPPKLRDVLTGEQACRDAGGLFFNDPDAPKETEAGRIAAAKELCLGDSDARPACPVLEECRHYALHRETSGGVWGGMSYKQIKAMRRELGITADPPIRMDVVFESDSKEAVWKRAERARKREVVDVDLPEIDDVRERGDEGWCAA
jgi:hypothetical protein